MLLLLALWCDEMHRMWIWCLKMSTWGNAKEERYVHQFSPLLPWTLHRGSKDYKKICGPELEQREIKNFENVNPEVWQNNASVSIGCSCILYLADSTGIWYGNFASMIQAGECSEILHEVRKNMYFVQEWGFRGPYASGIINGFQSTEPKRRKLFKANHLDW